MAVHGHIAEKVCCLKHLTRYERPTILEPKRTKTPSKLQESVMSSQQPDRILSISAVLDRTGLSRATLYRKVARGTFPPQIHVANRSKGWQESAVNDWLKNPMFWSLDDACQRQS